MAIATTAELASYLQQDLDNATAILALALVESEIAAVFGGTMPDPVPGIAKGIQLAAAGRVYTNPTGVQSESVGPFSRNFGTGGVLNLDEIARLSRLRGSSYTVSLAGPDPAVV